MKLPSKTNLTVTIFIQCLSFQFKESCIPNCLKLDLNHNLDHKLTEIYKNKDNQTNATMHFYKSKYATMLFSIVLGSNGNP